MSEPCIYCGVRPDVPCKHKFETKPPPTTLPPPEDGRRARPRETYPKRARIHAEG